VIIIGVLLLLTVLGVYAAIVSGAREDEMKARLIKRLHEERAKRNESPDEEA
jgi:3'-phosphoadenosine 5'-phosphosulfate sulfotransferase (PAPS reductase)/FAD synthetase